MALDPFDLFKSLPKGYFDSSAKSPNPSPILRLATIIVEGIVLVVIVAMLCFVFSNVNLIKYKHIFDICRMGIRILTVALGACLAIYYWQKKHHNNDNVPPPSNHGKQLPKIEIHNTITSAEFKIGTSTNKRKRTQQLAIYNPEELHTIIITNGALNISGLVIRRYKWNDIAQTVSFRHSFTIENKVLQPTQELIVTDTIGYQFGDKPDTFLKMAEVQKLLNSQRADLN